MTLSSLDAGKRDALGLTAFIQRTLDTAPAYVFAVLMEMPAIVFQRRRFQFLLDNFSGMQGVREDTMRQSLAATAPLGDPNQLEMFQPAAVEDPAFD